MTLSSNIWFPKNLRKKYNEKEIQRKIEEKKIKINKLFVHTILNLF